MPQGYRGRGRPINTWKLDLQREMWTAGFTFSCRKMETAAQDRAGWIRMVCGLCSTGSDKTYVKLVKYQWKKGRRESSLDETAVGRDGVAWWLNGRVTDS